MRRAALLLAVCFLPGFAPAAEQSRRPNIVVILADDLGYGDVQCYNPTRGKIPTPRIDRLAAEGMRFTDAHSSSAACSPSRYTLLTGRYHWRTRLQQGIVGYLERPLIEPDTLSIAGLLKQQAYHTACIGKWHLGWNWNVPKGERPLFAPQRGKVPEVTERHLAAWRALYSRPIADGPTTRGFDEYFGTDVPNWPPYCFIENDRTIGMPTEFLPPELFTNHLASLPGPALADWKLEGVLPALAERACGYIERQAKSGEPLFLYLPLTSPHTPLAVNEPWRGKSGLTSAVADLIMETDAVVGRVLDTLAASGAAENTLVVFTSDNGFAAYVGADHLEAQGHFPSGPLRGYKRDAWEGGHRLAFLVRWPGVVQPGTTCDQLVHQADLMATFAEVVGTSLPAGAGPDSYSLLPLLKGSNKPVREHAVSQSAGGQFALRRDDRKLIFAPDAAAKDGPPAQLYNLADDLGETKNRYAEQPEISSEMTALLKELIARGRSTPGAELANDVPVNWQRFMEGEQ